MRDNEPPIDRSLWYLVVDRARVAEPAVDDPASGVLGEALLAGSPALGIYWAAWFLAVNLFVIGYEEPALRRRFGASYDEYARHVSRWLPKQGR